MSNDAIAIITIAEHLISRGLDMVAITVEAADSGAFIVVADDKKQCEYVVWLAATDGVGVATHNGNYFRYHDAKINPYVVWTRNEAKVQAIHRMVERAGIVPTP